MNPQDKIPALKNNMPNDPVVDILDDLCKQMGTIAGKIVSMEEYGITLRHTRVWAFFIIFVIGMMSGGTIARLHYEKPDSLDASRRAGVRIIIADDGTNISLDMESPTCLNAEVVYDSQNNKLGARVIFQKEQRP